MTLVELTIAALLLGVAMTATVQILGWVAAERRSLERRQCAVQEAGNLMERLSARPWDRLPAAGVRDVTLSEPARRLLPGAELTVAVDEPDRTGPVESKRIALRIRWRNRAGGWDAPVRLSAWTYRRPERSAP
jgi:hypothetical protein